MKQVIFLTIVVILAVAASVSFGQKVIEVTAGIDQIKAAYAAASDGDIIELVTSGGIYREKATLKITKAITIRAAKGLENKPIIETENVDRHFEPTGACSYFGLFGVKVTGLVDDGVADSKDSTKYALRVRNMSGPYTLVFENVDFDHFYSTEKPPEGYVVRFDNTAVLADLILFKNCKITRLAKHAIRLDGPTAAPGQFKQLILENCTFADIGGRAVFATLINDPAVTPASVYIDHCTFFKIADDAVKINNGLDVKVQNSIFHTIADKVLDADSTAVYTTATVQYCDTLSTDGFSDFLNLTASNIYAEDPEFADPNNLDLTVSDFFKGIAVGNDGFVVGDLRWDPLNPVENGMIRLTEGTNKITNAYNYAVKYGIQEIELATSGGTYLESNTLRVLSPLTIKAAEGLAQKPIIETLNTERHFEPRGACTYFALKGVKVSGFVDDGVANSADSTKYAMRIRNMNQPYTLVCENVDFDHFYSTEKPPEGYVARFDNTAVLAEEIRFVNCTVTRLAKHALRLDGPTAAPGQFKKLHIENCTFADIGGRVVFATLMNKPEVPPAEVWVNHCTFYKINDDALKINNGVDLVVKNSIFHTIADKVLDADSAAVYTSAAVTFCDTLNTDGFSRFLNLTTSNIYAEDPEFFDADHFDFHVSPFFAGIAIGDDGRVVGDPRWSPPTNVALDRSPLPSQFMLQQNYPNPFNPTTTIAYELPRDGHVTLSVFNLLGQKVATLVDREQKAGKQMVQWDGRDENGRSVGNGIYLLRLEMGEYSLMKKMTLLK